MLTEKENHILDEAEDLILWEVENYLEESEAMTNEDISNFQMLMTTFEKVLGLRFGRF